MRALRRRPRSREGEEVKTYLCSYRFRDAQWSLEIPADSEAEAYLRLQAIGSSGQVDGVLCCRKSAAARDDELTRLNRETEDLRK